MIALTENEVDPHSLSKIPFNAAHVLHFSSANGPLQEWPAILKWLTASLYLSFKSFARSFHPGTLNFEGFCIPNICLPLLSIAFDINARKSVSPLASVPLLCRGKMLLARGMAAYVRDGYRAFCQPKFQSGCCEMLFFLGFVV